MSTSHFRQHYFKGLLFSTFLHIFHVAKCASILVLIYELRDMGKDGRGICIDGCKVPTG